MKVWKSGCLGAIYIHEISKKKIFYKVLDLIRTRESEIERKDFFVKAVLGRVRAMKMTRTRQKRLLGMEMKVGTRDQG